MGSVRGRSNPSQVTINIILGYLCRIVGLSVLGDNGNASSSNVVVYVGGNYNQNQNYGLFYQNSNAVTNSNATIGSRFLAKFAQQIRLSRLRRAS